MAVAAYVLIRCEGGKADDVMERLRKMRHIIRADTVFGDYDIIAQVEVRELPSSFSIKSLERIIIDEIQKVSGVTSTNTHILTSPEYT